MCKQRLKTILHDRVWWLCLVIVFVWMLIFGDTFLGWGIATYNERADQLWVNFVNEHDLRWETQEYIEENYKDEWEAVSAEFHAEMAEEMPKVKGKAVSITTQNVFMMLLCLMIPVSMTGRHLMDKQSDAPTPTLKRRLGLAALGCIEGWLIVAVLNALATGLLVGKWMIHAKLGVFDPVGAQAWFWVLWVKPMVIALLWLPPLQFFVFLCREFLAPVFLTILAGLVLGFIYYFPLSSDLFRLPVIALPFERYLQPDWGILPEAVAVCVLWAGLWCALGALLWNLLGRKKKG